VLEPRKFIFDTDPGVDDAMAFLFAMASPELELVGITTVFGNGGIGTTTQNALRLVELVGRPDIPVVAGAARPLLHPYAGRGAHVHGADGLGETHMPAPAGRPQPGHAAQFIIDTVMANPGRISLVAVGPLTNLALAVSLEPRIAQAVRQVVIMGGTASRPGNVTPVAEANIHNDSAAARIVFDTEWPLSMVGLDVTCATVMSPAYLQELSAIGNRATDFIAAIVSFYLDFHRSRGQSGIYVHDSSAIAYVLDPSLFTVKTVPVYVRVEEGKVDGQTIPDWSAIWSGSHKVNVCLEVDSPRFLAMYKERLATYD